MFLEVEQWLLHQRLQSLSRFAAWKYTVDKRTKDLFLTESLLACQDKYNAVNYKPLPVVLNKGLGVHVWDIEGKQYLDFLSAYR